VLPPIPADRPRRLLVYLHGMLPPTPGFPLKRGFETVLLEASQRAGVAMMIPRGRPGIGPSFAREWWAWPTHADDIERLTPSIVERWATAKATLEAIAGAPFDRTYLAGVSNGAYYLTAIALRGDVPTERFSVDGFGAISGGGATERLLASAARPFYVGYGIYDEISVNNARPLVGALRAAGWPVQNAEHRLAHGLNAVYVDEALAFWESAGSSPLASR
jgi:predicted esterase